MWTVFIEDLSYRQLCLGRQSENFHPANIESLFWSFTTLTDVSSLYGHKRSRNSPSDVQDGYPVFVQCFDDPYRVSPLCVDTSALDIPHPAFKMAFLSLCATRSTSSLKRRSAYPEHPSTIHPTFCGYFYSSNYHTLPSNMSTPTASTATNNSRVVWDFEKRYALFQLMEDAALTPANRADIWNAMFPADSLHRRDPVPNAILRSQYRERTQRGERAVPADWLNILRPADTLTQAELDERELIDDHIQIIRDDLHI